MFLFSSSFVFADSYKKNKRKQYRQEYNYGHHRHHQDHFRNYNDLRNPDDYRYKRGFRNFHHHDRYGRPMHPHQYPPGMWWNHGRHWNWGHRNFPKKGTSFRFSIEIRD